MINLVFGFMVAWTLTRYEFAGKGGLDALVISLRTADLSSRYYAHFDYAENGLIGRFFAPLGIKIAFAPLGVVVALTFIGLPFVVRTVQPVLQDLEAELEEAAAMLGASRLQTFGGIGPALFPAVITGFALAFARALANTDRSFSFRVTYRSAPKQCRC